MKTLKQILIVVAALCAVSAQADYSLSAVALGNPNVGTAVPIVPGLTYDYYVNLAIPVSFQNAYYDSTDYTLQRQSGASWVTLGDVDAQMSIVAGIISGQLVTTTPTTVQVAWVTDPSLVLGDTYRIQAFWSVDGAQYDYGNAAAAATSYSYFTASVPEPTQVLASSVLFGIGGLFFVGRRLIKKQAQ
jgi:hypothetical protein